MRFFPFGGPLSCGLVLAQILASADPLQAQKGSAYLFGTIVNKATQGPISQAVITHAGDGRVVRSDSLGYYRFPELRAGIVRFIVRVPGFPATTFSVALTNGERMERDIELDPPVALPPEENPGTILPTVTVEAASPLGRRYADFERRKSQGRGHFLTRSQIQQLGAANLQDAVRGLRGVNIECGGGEGCFIRMARAPMNCRPEYVVDERVDNMFGPSIAIGDIEAIEVYTGPSDVAAEFGGRNAGCGVVVIWTRAGPPRKRGGN